jgi:hypothetical protein
MRRWILPWKRKRPAGPRIVGVTGQDVRVQMRKRIAEQLVIQLDRPEVVLERPSDLQDLEPVGDRLPGLELGGLGDVAAAPDRDRVAALDGCLLEVGVAHLAGEEPHAPPCLVGAALAAHLTALAASERVERVGPLHGRRR